MQWPTNQGGKIIVRYGSGNIKGNNMDNLTAERRKKDLKGVGNLSVGGMT